MLGTLFSLDAVRARLSTIGAPAATLEAWFERTLHSALTLTTVGEFRPFREVARTSAGEATLIAAHAWDVVGARAAGLDAIWVDRLECRWPLPVAEPRRAASLLEGVEALLSASPGPQ